MAKTKTTGYDVAEHLRTPEEMAAYLDACLEEPGADAAFIAKATTSVATPAATPATARTVTIRNTAGRLGDRK